MNFLKAVRYIIKREGGFTDDPDDSGNWTGGEVGKGILKGTKYGISAASYPHLNIKELTEPQAERLYYDDFWNPCKCDSLPNAVRLGVFEVATMSGCKTAISTLQKAINKASVVVDGIIGPKTISEANRANLTAMDYARQRAKIYVSAIRSKPVKIKYLGGWIDRIFLCVENS